MGSSKLNGCHPHKSTSELPTNTSLILSLRCGYVVVIRYMD